MNDQCRSNTFWMLSGSTKSTRGSMKKGRIIPFFASIIIIMIGLFPSAAKTSGRHSLNPWSFQPRLLWACFSGFLFGPDNPGGQTHVGSLTVWPS